jgi:uncharacterized repeat protein (TIGR01451 family)
MTTMARCGETCSPLGPSRGLLALRLALAVACLCAAAAHADCRSVAGNLLTNCHFDTDTAGWTATGGNLSRVNDGSPPVDVGPGAAQIDGSPNIGMRQCVATGAGQYLFAAHYKATNASAETCYVTLRAYGTSDCSDGELTNNQLSDGAFSGGWEGLSGSLIVSGGVAGLGLEVSCVGVYNGVTTDNASARFDDMVLADATLVVDGSNCELWEAIIAANTNSAFGGCRAGTSGLDIIRLGADVSLASADTTHSNALAGAYAGLPTVTSDIRILAFGGSVIARGPAGCANSQADAFRLFNVTNGTLELVGLTLRHGCVAPATGDGAGGAIRLESSGRLIASSTIFDGNIARGADNPSGTGGQGSGGAISLADTQPNELQLTDTTFSANLVFGGEGSAGAGGGALGGAIATASGSNLGNIWRTTFQGNNALAGSGTTTGGAARGGALDLDTTTTPNLQFVVFASNVALGGAGDVTGGAAFGGAISQLGGSLTSLSDARFDGNAASGGLGGTTGGMARGGALRSTGTITDLRRASFGSNVAAGGFGSTGGLAQGGGIFASGAIGSLVNCTLGGNTASGGEGLDVGGQADGGGLHSAAATVVDSTLAGNAANGGNGPSPGVGIGGGIYATGAVTAQSSIFGANTAFVGVDCASGASFTSSYNLFGVSSPNCPTTATDLEGGPQLGPLQDNGCSSPLPGGVCVRTMAPQGTSPALDQGSCAVTGEHEDARGRFRPRDLAAVPNAADGCDIGAHEAEPHDLELAISESVDPYLTNVGAGPLTYLVTLSNVASTTTTGIVVDIALLLPSGVGLSSAVPTAGAWNGGTGEWSLASLPGNSNATLTLTLTVADATAHGTDVIGCDAAVTAADQADDDGVPASASARTSVAGPLAGAYTIGGSSPTYASIEAAIADLTANGVSGAVTFLIRAGTHTAPTGGYMLAAVATMSAANTVTFRPDAGATVLITGNELGGIFVLEGAKHFVFDGSNSGGSSRDMTIRNLETTYGPTVWLRNDADSNTFRNLNLQGNAASQTNISSSQGIGVLFIGQTTAASGNDDNLVANCTIGDPTGANRGNIGVGIFGTAGNANSRNRITASEIVNFGASGSLGIGVEVSAELDATTVDHCTIHNAVPSPVSGSLYGIYTDSSPGFPRNSIFTDNRLFDLHAAAASPDRHGIYHSVSTADADTLIANNMISLDQGGAGRAYGIYFQSSIGTTRLYHNSIYLAGEATGSTAAISAVLYKAGANTVDSQNNLLVSARSGATQYGLYLDATSGWSSDYNLIEAHPGDGSTYTARSGSDLTTLADYQATGQDTHSVGGDVPFVAAATDLHVVPGSVSPNRNAGTMLAAVPLDFDGETRDATPDIGADELLAAPSLAKAFEPAAVYLGEVSTLSFTVTNPNTVESLQGVGFVDPLPAGLIVASTPNAGSSGCGSPSFAPSAGATSVAVSGATVVAGAPCTLHVDVVATTTGSKVNTTGVVSSSNAGAGNTAGATLDVALPPADLAITKSDGVGNTSPGATVVYIIHASNAGPSPAPGSVVTDVFPAGCASHSFTSSTTGGATGNTAGPSTANIGDTLSLPVGSTVMYTASCTLSAGATSPLVNTATIAAGASVVDPSLGDNSATDMDTVGNLVFADGFESGDPSHWSGSAGLSFATSVAARLPAGALSTRFDFNLAALPATSAFGPSTIATMTDAEGRQVLWLAVRRRTGGAPLELALAAVDRSSGWTAVAESRQRLLLAWAVTDGRVDTLSLMLGGRLGLWLYGFLPTDPPTTVRVMRHPRFLE